MAAQFSEQAILKILITHLILFIRSLLIQLAVRYTLPVTAGWCDLRMAAPAGVLFLPERKRVARTEVIASGSAAAYAERRKALALILLVVLPLSSCVQNGQCPGATEERVSRDRLAG